MKELKSIVINYNLAHSTNFNASNVLSGDILLSDNGYFEGILKSSTIDKMFVFGMYLENEFTELNQIVDGRIYRFHADGKENSQQGYFGEADMFDFSLQGSCQILIKESPITSKETLETQLDEAKLKLVEYNKSFYEKVKSNENSYLENMKKSYTSPAVVQFIKKQDHKPSTDDILF